MKHGDKAKATAKTSPAKSKTVIAKAGKPEEIRSRKSGKVAAEARGGEKAAIAKSEKGKRPARQTESENSGFSSPVVASSYKHAVKNYGSALKRLTD